MERRREEGRKGGNLRRELIIYCIGGIVLYGSG